MRDMIIALDWTVERVENDLDVSQQFNQSRPPGFGPVTSSLITALWQKAAPIVTSVVTWKNFLQRREIYNDFITFDLQALIIKYKKTFVRFNTDEEISAFATQCKALLSQTQFGTLRAYERKEINGFLLCFLVPFDPKEWIVEQFGNCFYLLIPKIYQENQRAKKDYPEEIVKFKKSLPDRGRILGLKIGTPVASPLDYTKISEPLFKKADYQKEFFQILPQLFVTVKDVEDYGDSKEKTEENKARFLPHWYFYLIGHGGPSQGSVPGFIAGLSSFQFPNLLFFLNNTIQTDFLFYTTCFAGGEHLMWPYERTWFYPSIRPGASPRRAIMPETFNYIIAADTISYAPTIGWSPGIPLPFILGSSHIKFSQNFPLFFKSIKQYFYPEGKITSSWDLARILNYVNSFLTETEEFEEKLRIPVIRYPNTEWFSIIDFNKKILRLSRVFVEAKEAAVQEIIIQDKEVVIIDPKQFFGRRKEIIDREHSEILVPIRIKKDGEQKKLPAIISSAIAPASHYFDKIVVRSLGGFVDFLHSFFHVKQEAYGRTYYIKTLLCRNDLADYAGLLGANYGESLELSDVIIVVNDRNLFDKYDVKKYNGVIFRYQIQNFAVFWPADDIKNNEKFKMGKLPWLNKIKESIPPYPFALPEIKYKEIIEALKLKQARGAPKPIEKPKPSVEINLNQLQQELKKLFDKLSVLNKQLSELKT